MNRTAGFLLIGFVIGVLLFYGVSERVRHLDAEERLQNCLGAKR